MKITTAGPEHEALMQAFKACIGREGKDMDAMHILAIASQFVGNLVAVQDCRRYSTRMVMEVVATNIEQGNRAAVEALIP